jgi:hypothetical protein
MADPKYFGAWDNHILYRMCNEQPAHRRQPINRVATLSQRF